MQSADPTLDAIHARWLTGWPGLFFDIVGGIMIAVAMYAIVAR